MASRQPWGRGKACPTLPAGDGLSKQNLTGPGESGRNGGSRGRYDMLLEKGISSAMRITNVLSAALPALLALLPSAPAPVSAEVAVQAQRGDHPHRRPGLRRTGRHRQPADPHAAHRPPGDAERVVGQLSRDAGLLADAGVPDDRTLQLPHRRDGHLPGPLADAPRRDDAGANARRRRLSHGHLRQVAPGRQLPDAGHGPGLSGIAGPQRRRPGAARRPARPGRRARGLFQRHAAPQRRPG